jgi:hypothetical protein
VSISNFHLPFYHFQLSLDKYVRALLTTNTTYPNMTLSEWYQWDPEEFELFLQLEFLDMCVRHTHVLLAAFITAAISSAVHALLHMVSLRLLHLGHILPPSPSCLTCLSALRPGISELTLVGNPPSGD